MTTDAGTITERLAAQDPAEKQIRNRLIQRGYGIREATVRAARMTRGARTRQITEGPSAPSQKAIAEAVAQAVASATAARKAAKKARRCATTEAAAARVIQERQRLAAQFSEAAVGKSLRESSGDDLAAIAAAALSGTGQPGPAARPVAEVTVDARALSLEDLGLAATAGTAGNSPFWQAHPGGSPAAGQSPFWQGLQVSGASKGTASA